MSLFKSLDVFNDLFERSFILNDINYHINPKINETDTSYDIDFIVPGYKKEEISVTIEGKNLVVEAKKGDEKTSYTKYNKSIYFPNGVENISAKLENGILTVSIPKEKTKKDKIKVDIK